MRFKILLLSAFAFAQFSFAQVITWTPLFPTASDSITVIFNAAEGNAGLKGYIGDVYAHTGVITNLSTTSTDWKYVKTNWGQNTPETKLERIGTDLYQFKIKPSVTTFYGVPSSETIINVAFVFRSASSPYKEGKTATLGDIFLPLSQAGLNLTFSSPKQTPLFVNLNDTVNIHVTATQSVNLELYIENNLILQTSDTSLVYNWAAAGYGKKWIKAVAVGADSSIKADSFYVYVKHLPTIQELPAGVVDGINYISNTSVILSLYAPYKNFVYVIGDFNNWDIDENYQMKMTPDSSRYWLEINGLQPQKEYIFQYFVDGKLKIGDPYADKISDPNNDKWISNSTYPGLLPYPAGKTTEIATYLQTAQQPYQWKVNNFKRPEKNNLVIYELLIRDFLSTHDYKTLADTLGYLERLGVNAIELMPVMEFEGNESWGYNPIFYFAPDKYYGPKNDLKAFIDKAHEMGIAVILDIVLNHTYGQSPMVRLYADNPALSPWYNVKSPNPVFSWGYDFNHESKATQAFVDRVNKYWLQEYHADGYRFDFTKGFTNTTGDGYDASRIAILERMAGKIWDYDSTAYVILEHFAANSEEIVLSNFGMMLWGNMNHNYNQATMGYPFGPSGSGWTWDLSGISYKTRGWTNPNLVGYMESHDEERLMYKNLQFGNSSGNYNVKDLATALDRIKLASAFFFTIPGPKMIWQFGELGYDVSIDDPCRVCNKPIRWYYYNDENRLKLYKVMQAVIKLKTNYSAFKSSTFSMDAASAVKRINIADSTMNINIIGNFDVVQRSTLPYFNNTGTWYDYFSGDSIMVTNLQNQINLQPGEFHIYTTVKLPAPDSGIVTDINELSESVVNNYDLLQNYPNPFNPATKIIYAIPSAGTGYHSVQQKVTLIIYDILGREVKTLVNGYKQAGKYAVNFDGSNLSSGTYFYQLKVNDKIFTKKMLLLK